MRRPPGTGTVTHRGGNRWFLRITLADGTRRASTVTATDEKDARRQLDDLVTLLGHHGQGAVGGVTLRGYVAAWLDRCDRSGSRSRKTYRSRAENYLLTASWADDLLVNLTPKMIRRHFRDLQVGHSTAKVSLSLLRTILAAAVEDDVIQASPAEGVRLPRQAVDRVRDPLTHHELEQLLKSTDGADRALLAVAALCGLRSGEAHALPLDCVQPPRLVVKFGGFGGAPTKSGRPRVVPLYGPALAAVEAWLAEVPRDRTRNPEQLLFPGRFGGRRRLSHASGWLRVRLAAIGVDRPLRFHDLRHTAAVGLENGWWLPPVPREYVQAILGHASISQTEAYSGGAGEAMLRAFAQGVGAVGPKDQGRISGAVSRVGLSLISARSEPTERRKPCSDSGSVIAGGYASADPSTILAEKVVRGAAEGTLTEGDVMGLADAVLASLPEPWATALAVQSGEGPTVAMALRLAEAVLSRDGRRAVAR